LLFEFTQNFAQGFGAIWASTAFASLPWEIKESLLLDTMVNGFYPNLG
jgi:hypothetical protein